MKTKTQSPPTYSVYTWDIERGEFTQQDGLKNESQGVTLRGLRRVLRELKSLGYPCWYRSYDGAGDCYVSVWRD
jgi:hypothetical protein